MKLLIIHICIIFLSSTIVCNPTHVDSVKTPEDITEKTKIITPLPRGKIDREKRSLADWLERNTRSPHVPSSAVVIVNGNRVIFKKATTTTCRRIYPIASFTKTFTALAVLHLADRGLLNLDDHVSRYLPVKLEREEINSKPVTIRNLLNHTSGIADRGNFRVVDLDPPIEIPIQRYPAGYQFSYSNSGYNLLGRLVSKVSGKSLGCYITENILRPMEMRNSVAPGSMKGSAGMRCSLDDMANYLKMLLGRGKYNGRRIISGKQFNEMFKQSIGIPPAKNKEYRGIAWRVWTVDDKLYSYNHASLWYGSGGWIQIFPAVNVGYVFMSDTPDFKLPAFDKFYRGLKHRLLKFAGLFCDNELDPRAFRPTLPDKGMLIKFSGRYHNPLNRISVNVITSKGYLIAVNPSFKIRYRLIPTTVNTFIHKRDKNPSVLKYDFIWKDNRVIGFAARDGYYIRIKPLSSPHRR